MVKVSKGELRRIMIYKDSIIIGGGPCGLSAAIELQNAGEDIVVIEKENIVNSIYNYPTHQTFFSTSLKLSIGDIPFITASDKPKRNDALVYYRKVAEIKQIPINSFEKVESIIKVQEGFHIISSKTEYTCKNVIIATGYYDNPNKLDIEGENLPHVFHYFKEGHPYYGKRVVIIGGKNSSIDAALELEKAGAFVTVVYRGDSYSPSVKPWILPGFDSLVKSGDIDMRFNSEVIQITEKDITISENAVRSQIECDYVFAMIGYHPDHAFLKGVGIEIDPVTGRPSYNEETMESNIPGLYIAGVIAAGNNANEIFIENGKLHGKQIANAIRDKRE